jgi:hypothetical protein
VTIIGFAGKLESGKSTAAKFLVEDRGFEKLSFAEPLREEVADAFNYGEQFRQLCEKAMGEGPQAAISRRLIAALVACRKAGYENPWSKPTPEPMRNILQLWGTEYRRLVDLEHWVKAIRRRLLPLRKYVIDDVRFHNELALMHYSIYLRRRDRFPLAVGYLGHISESSIAPEDCDEVMKNDYSEEEPFRKAILAAYDRLAK